VNLSVGYKGEHTDDELLVIRDWENTLDLSRKWFSEPDIPRFGLPWHKGLRWIIRMTRGMGPIRLIDDVGRGFDMRGMTSERNWHLSWGGKTYGPFGIEAIKTMASKGEFDPSTSYAWKPGFEGWKPCGEIEEISSICPVVQIPPELAKKRIELRLGLGVDKLRFMSLFFDDLGYFNNGLAAVKIGGKWGLIDKTGKVIVEPAFDDVKEHLNKITC